MICYKDKAFCSSTECVNKECHRFLSLEVLEGARKWWGSDGAPIASSDFHEGCSGFVRGSDKEREEMLRLQKARFRNL